MRNKLSSLHPTHKQLIKFLIVGAISTVLDWGTYYLLTRHTGYFGIHLIGAKVSSSVLVSVFSFTSNRFWSFGKSEKINLLEVARFYLSAAVGVGINAGTTFIFIHFFHVYDLIAIVLATAVTFSWNFGVSKFWVFKK